jgi:hypothetical protein
VPGNPFYKEHCLLLLADAAHLSLRAAAGDTGLMVAIGHVGEAQIPEAYQHVRRRIGVVMPDLAAKNTDGFAITDLGWVATGRGRK